MTAGVLAAETLGAVTLGWEPMAILGAVAVGRAPLTACAAPGTRAMTLGTGTELDLGALATGVLTVAAKPSPQQKGPPQRPPAS